MSRRTRRRVAAARRRLVSSTPPCPGARPGDALDARVGTFRNPLRLRHHGPAQRELRLSHRYELAAGAYYAHARPRVDLPARGRAHLATALFHVNASILSFYAALLTGSCQIQTDRFQPTRWWQEVRDTRATIVHYLGVIVQMLCAHRPPGVRGIACYASAWSAGVEPPVARAAFGRNITSASAAGLWGADGEH